MNSLNGCIATVIGALGDARFPYVVTGSIASIYCSEPRTTMDPAVVGQADLTDLKRRLTTEMAVSTISAGCGDSRSSDLPNDASVSPEAGSVRWIRGWTGASGTGTGGE